MLRSVRSQVLSLSLPVLLLPAVAVAQGQKPLMKDFMAINGHFKFKPGLYRPICRLVRNYHNLNWDVDQPGDPITFPVCVNRVHWDKHVYGPWKEHGFETSLCVQFGSFGRGNKAYRELWVGKERWAYEYGKTIATYCGPSGKHQLCTSIEIGNEPGAGFDDTLYQTIFKEMARGIRDGDPKIKIVTATAHARDADPYSKDLRSTFSARDILPLYDVINLHTYAQVDRGEDKTISPWTRSYPEDPEIPYLKVVDEAIAWRNAHAPGKEIWITEFGYDACTPEAMGKRKGWFEKLDWQGVTDLQQAQYLVRSFLVFAERDVDRAYLYFYDDDDQAGVHAAAGLTRHFQPKPSFWAVKQFRDTLGEYRFRRVIMKKADELYVVEFVHGDDPDRLVWVAWSPTGVRTDAKTGYQGHRSVVTLDALPAIPIRVFGMATTDGAASEVKWKNAGPGVVSLTIDESPCYLIMEKSPN